MWILVDVHDHMVIVYLDVVDVNLGDPDRPGFVVGDIRSDREHVIAYGEEMLHALGAGGLDYHPGSLEEHGLVEVL